jgi:hypothetical protein
MAFHSEIFKKLLLSISDVCSDIGDRGVRIIIEVLEIGAASELWDPGRRDLLLVNELPIYTTEPYVILHILCSILKTENLLAKD